MDQHWERQWILVCLGVVSIGTVALGVAFASADLVNVAERQAGSSDATLVAIKFVLLFVEAATYLLLVARARSAMFSTDDQLENLVTDRRRAVRGVYDILFWQLYFLIGLVAVVIAERWP